MSRVRFLSLTAPHRTANRTAHNFCSLVYALLVCSVLVEIFIVCVALIVIWSLCLIVLFVGVSAVYFKCIRCSPLLGSCCVSHLNFTVCVVSSLWWPLFCRCYDNQFIRRSLMTSSSMQPQAGLWRNGSASDSRSEGWELESLWPHFTCFNALWTLTHALARDAQWYVTDGGHISSADAAFQQITTLTHIRIHGACTRWGQVGRTTSTLMGRMCHMLMFHDVCCL